MSNVVSFNNTIETKIEEKIADALDNRCGNWVSEAFLVGRVIDMTTPTVKAMDVIDKMVSEGKLEKTFHTVQDKFGHGVRLYSYRLAFDWDKANQ